MSDILLAFYSISRPVPPDMLLGVMECAMTLCIISTLEFDHTVTSFQLPFKSIPEELSQIFHIYVFPHHVLPRNDRTRAVIFS